MDRHVARRRFGQNFLVDPHYVARIVGNLPYNISSPLLFHLATYEARLRDIHVMLQREVVARMTASPATADYGRLSVMLQARFRVTRLFTVPAGAFRPAPKVESAVARLAPLRESRPVIVDESALRSAGIDPGSRGETLSVDDYVRLTNALAGPTRPRGATSPPRR